MYERVERLVSTYPTSNSCDVLSCFINFKTNRYLKLFSILRARARQALLVAELIDCTVQLFLLYLIVYGYLRNRNDGCN